MSTRKKGGRAVRRKTTSLNKIKKDIRDLKKEHHLKFVGITLIDAVVAVTGSVNTQIFIIPDGDAQSEKAGLRIMIKSIQIRFVLTLPSTATLSNSVDICRVILVQDRQCNGALPSVDDILNGASFVNLKNVENTRRFSTLLDRSISINSMGAQGNGTVFTSLPAIKHFSFYKTMNMPVYYNNSANTGVITTINSNNLVMLFISENGNCGLKARIRVRYTD